MRRTTPQDLLVRPFTILDQQWALLVAGSEHPNPMTVSWGGLGTLWDRPVATVYVRPTRFTFSLLGAEPFFTLNFLPEPYRAALDLCGSTSGRNTDKWQAAMRWPRSLILSVFRPEVEPHRSSAERYGSGRKLSVKNGSAPSNENVKRVGRT